MIGRGSVKYLHFTGWEEPPKRLVWWTPKESGSDHPKSPSMGDYNDVAVDRSESFPHKLIHSRGELRERLTARGDEARWGQNKRVRDVRPARGDFVERQTFA